MIGPRHPAIDTTVRPPWARVLQAVVLATILSALAILTSCDNRDAVPMAPKNASISVDPTLEIAKPGLATVR